jgi:flagellar motility protein MotE (MotC chaperone)
MADEVPSTEIPQPEIPPANPAPPPAASLVVNGIIKNERELQLERRENELAERERKARELEEKVARREMTIQEREKILATVPPVPTPKPAKVKRARLFPTILNTDPDENE